MSDQNPPSVPPPPSGGDFPPPPPPPPSYGAPPGSAGGYNATDAFGYGWKMFFKNPGPLLIAVLVVLVGVGIIGFVIEWVSIRSFTSSASTSYDANTGQFQVNGGSGLIARLVAIAIVVLVVSAIYQLAYAALVKGALDTVDGKGVNLGQLTDGWDKGQVLIAALILGVAQGIGTMLCYVPGLAVAYLGSFTMFFIVDKHLGAIDAIKASISFTTQNFGVVILFAVLAVVAFMVGAIACLIGLLVAVPVVLIAAAYTFRSLHGEPLTPVA